MAQLILVVKNRAVREDGLPLLHYAIRFVGMPEKMILRFYLFYSIAQRQVSPMCSTRFVQYHHGRLMRDKYIYISRDKIFLMIIAQAKELYAANITTSILQEDYIARQILDILGIP